MASPPEIPASLRALMAEIGPRWANDIPGHIRTMIDAFSQILKDAPKDGVQVLPGIAYGDHPRQHIDAYLPEKDTLRPAVLFVHGGAFVDGNRNRSAEIYANVLYYFARSQVVGINIGYRLAGDATYPGAAIDIAAAVQWVRDHARELGIDRNRIFLMGHSAGGAHAGTYAYDARVQPASGPGLAGLIIVSGRVRADNSEWNPNRRKVEAYYGTDASLFEDRSPVSHVSAASLPTFIAWAEYENPLIDVYCLELCYRLAAAKRKAPPTLWLPGHNHTSIIAQFNTAEDRLGRALLDFIGQSSHAPAPGGA